MVVIGGVCWWGWWVVFCCVLSCFVVFLWCVLDGALWWEAPPATPRANLCWGAAAPQTPLSSWRGSAPPDLPCESRSWPASGYSFGGGACCCFFCSKSKVRTAKMCWGGCCPPIRPPSLPGGALPLQTSPVQAGHGQHLDTALVVVLAAVFFCCFGGAVWVVVFPWWCFHVGY